MSRPVTCTCGTCAKCLRRAREAEGRAALRLLKATPPTPPADPRQLGFDVSPAGGEKSSPTTPPGGAAFTEDAEAVEFGTTNPNVGGGDGWMGEAPDFGEGPAAPDVEAAEGAAWEAEVAARVARMGPAGVLVAENLVRVIFDGSAERCAELGKPWPLSGQAFDAARAVYLSCMVQTVAMVWPHRAPSKWDAPLVAVGGAVACKASVIIAERRTAAPRRPSATELGDEEAELEVNEVRTSNGEGLPWAA